VKAHVARILGASDVLLAGVAEVSSGDDFAGCPFQWMAFFAIYTVAGPEG
jgi:hypothetical protein